MQIPSFITQIVCNEKWTICGSINGEIFVYDNLGMAIESPIQMEEEIVYLHLTKLYYENNNNNMNNNNNNNNNLNLIENDSIYLMIITSDCVLKLWKLNINMIGFKPIQILKTNFNSLLNKNKKSSLKNGYVTNNEKIMLTLSNNYIYMYEKSYDSWLRISDDKYPLSIQRTQINLNNNNNLNQIGKIPLGFSQLLTSMN
eukprot:318978_1